MVFEKLFRNLPVPEKYSITIFVINKIQLSPNETAEIANFPFSHYKSMELLVAIATKAVGY